MGLHIWDQVADPYDHTQLADNWDLIDAHDHSPGRGVQIPTEGIADGAITHAKLASGVGSPAAGSITADQLADAAKLGLSDSVNVRRGYVSIPTLETTSSNTYTWLPTPDSIPNVEVPSNGLVFVAYQATWKESSYNTAKATIFLGTNQLKVTDYSNTSTAPFLMDALVNDGTTGANIWKSLTSSGYGLVSGDGSTTNWTGDVTTGQVVGNGTFGYGICTIFGPAGVYDIGVKFKNLSGATTTVQNRQLWVWTIGF